MVLTEFPNLQWLKTEAEKSFSGRLSPKGEPLSHPGWPNVVLNVTTKQTLRDQIRGPLSIFTNLTGSSTVSVGSKRTRVGDDLFFVSNHDQYYTLEIRQQTPVETFNIHFGEFFVDQVFHSATLADDILLENHFSTPLERIEFHNRLYHRDQAVQSTLLEIKNQPHPHDPCWLEEKLYDLVNNLLGKERGLLEMREKLPGLKSSTREEILKRLLVVTDYIQAHLPENLALDQLAAQGCLSKFHLLRLFKTAFGKTPHEFINEERVRRARALLVKTNLEVHEIASAVGFRDSSSFSRMFYKQQGGYPTQLRKALV